MAESARTSDGRWSCSSDGRWSPSRQSRSPQHRARCKLDGERCVSLANIVQAFNVPIEEEQAWAICYQCAKCMSELVGHERSCLVSEMRHVLLALDGSVHPNTFLLPPTTPSTTPTQGAAVRERASSEAKVVESLGLVIYAALDFKVAAEEERRLSAPLATLISAMTASLMDDSTSASTSASARANGSACNGHEADEGIEEDGPEVEQNSTRFGLKHVLESCGSHLSNPVQSEAHYKAVCRALVAEALELSTFLDKISSGSQELCLSGAGPGGGSSELVGLNVRDWARLWVQVIDELRRGVQLKKVGVSGSPPASHPIEFALTPYEILMDDIRSRRYKLKQVMVNGDLPPRVKKDAHAVILDFIRSRPPLRPLAKRPVAQRQQEPLSKHESLMESIRANTRTLRPVTPGSAGSRTEAPRPAPHTDQPTRRIIKVDTSLLNFATSDEDDDLLTPVTPDLASGSRSLFSPCASASTNKPTSGWHKTVTLDLTTHGDVTRVERRHSIGLCEQTPTVEGVPATSAPPTSEAERQTTNGAARGLFRSMVWKNSLECLSLTLDEVVHIRSVLTKAELENLLVGTPHYDDVAKGKLCFTCKKIRFSFFGPRGNKCRLCARVVCDKCSSKMRIPTEHFRNIPVYTLSPSPSSSGDEDTNHFSFWSSNNTPFINANGSAPSTPMVTPRSSHPPSVGGAPASLPPLPTRDSCAEEAEGVSSLFPRPTRKLMRSQTIQRDEARGGASGGRSEEKLRGAMMTVCKECKSMVCHVIVASRNSLTLKHKSNKGNLNLNLYDKPWRSSAGEAVSPTPGLQPHQPPPTKGREAITSQFRLNLTPFYTNDIGQHN